MTIYSTLLARGYFPKELPPAFSTELFAAFSTSPAGRAAIKAYKPADKFTECVEYRLASMGAGGLSSRALRIPHPYAYARLASLTAKNFRRLLKKAATSPFSRSRPVYGDEQPRALRTVCSPTDLARERVLTRAGASYLLKVDVSQFYPSLYTHAVGWAVDPKLRQRKYWGSSKLLGNQLDQCLMDSQRKFSQGIPIGPDLSFLLAEIVLGQVDKASGLPRERSYRWFDDYEISCSTRQEAEATLARLTTALESFKLRPNPLKTTIVELPRVAGDSWQTELLALAKRPLSSAGVVELFDHAYRLREVYPDYPVLMYAVGVLFKIPRPNDVMRKLSESCISQAIIVEPGCAQKAFALLTYWELNGAPFDRAVVGRTIDRLTELHESRGISSDVAWALAFAIQHELELGRAIGRRLTLGNDDAVMIEALHAHALGILPGLGVHSIEKMLRRYECDGDHWLALYESVRHGFLPGLKPKIEGNPLLGKLLEANVSFYRQDVPAYAALVHSGGAPQWVVRDWVTRVVKRGRRRGKLSQVEELIADALRTRDPAQRSSANALRLLGRRPEGRRVSVVESYE